MNLANTALSPTPSLTPATANATASFPVQSDTDFSHIRGHQTAFLPGGLRDFFVYKDLGVASATKGRVMAHIAKANLPPTDGTGWHYHVAEFQIVYMLKGWARFMYADVPTLVSAGDCVHQRPGIVHYLFDYSPDMEYLEIVGPADFASIAADAPCEVPPVTPWHKGGVA